MLTCRGANATTINVSAGGDVQAAINAAQPGDTILLAAGAVYPGGYKLPAKGGTSFITIRSAASDASLPAAGTRVTPASASLLAKVRAPTGGYPAFRTAPGASYWRLMFLEIYPQSTTSSANLVDLGAADSTQTTSSTVPQHLVIDRCYLHGDASFGQRRGIGLNSGDTQIINSYFSNFKLSGQDTQAMGGDNGPGPFLIENNYIEASGENILFGGGDPDIPNLVPGNITIRRNLISKPLAWMSQSWTVKNLIELKNAQNVLIEGNTIENNWAAGQQGYSIVLTPRNQDNTAPWSVVKNVTIQNNVVRHVAAVFNILGYDNISPSQQTQNIQVLNNLMYDVSSSYGTTNNPGNGLFAVIGAGPKDIVFNHNTVDADGHQTISFYQGTVPAGATWTISGFVLKNNLLRDNKYGIFSGGSYTSGTSTLNAYTPGYYMQANSIGGADPKLYPGGNDYPTLTQWLADFVSVSAANYQLVSSSLSNNAATDGKDIGVDFSLLNSAMSGSGSTDSTPPPTTTQSTPYSGSPISLPGTIQAENYDKGGEGVAYHDTTAGNSGGVYRSDGVDIKATTDTSGSYNIKSVRATEWLNYSVSVASAGTYTVGFRMASSGTGGTVHLMLDGTNVTGSVALPDTGGWDTWKTVSKTGVALTAGAHILKLVVDANGSGGTAADINWISVSSSSSAAASTPFTGTAIALPGTIQAENYDKGGEGVAYHDTTAGNSGGVYRSDGVDIKVTTDTSGSYNIKSVRATEWLNYSVSVASAGTYTVDFRMASSGTGGTVHLMLDGTNVTGSVALPDTGGWDTWKTVSKTGVALSAGAHVLKLVIDANGSGGTAADINWITVH
ncbi:MAG TPA: carbohydrate-binding protein [Vicinamibacterales bacterium]|nr:carbohydrate-binding protein [Vicinamibacterales bacterium]